MMNQEQIINELAARTGTDAEIAAAINADRFQKTERTARDIFEAFGSDVADAITTQLGTLAETKPSVGLLVETLKAGQPIDLGNAQVQATMAATSLSDEIKGGLLALAQRHAPVTEQDVTDAKAVKARRETVLPWVRAAEYARMAAETESLKSDATATSVRTAMIDEYDARVE